MYRKLKSETMKQNNFWLVEAEIPLFQPVWLIHHISNVSIPQQNVVLLVYNHPWSILGGNKKEKEIDLKIIWN